MNELLNKINELRSGSIGDKVRARLQEFNDFENKPTGEWFSELCFCLLTANSKARTALAIQAELGADGFLNAGEEKLVDCIKRNKHRFHNNKARFIVLAREHADVKDVVAGLSDFEAREWLVKNVKGLGFKEASHFLRNTGRESLAILDRHVLNLMIDGGLISEKPALTRSNYLMLEKKLAEWCGIIGMTQAELDLYLWYLRGGDVLK